MQEPMTADRVVAQSALCHPDWTPEIHAAYLTHECPFLTAWADTPCPPSEADWLLGRAGFVWALRSTGDAQIASSDEPRPAGALLGHYPNRPLADTAAAEWVNATLTAEPWVDVQAEWIDVVLRLRLVMSYLEQLPRTAHTQNGSDRAVLLVVAAGGTCTAAWCARTVGQAQGTVEGKLRGWEAVGVLRRHRVEGPRARRRPEVVTWWEVDPAWLRTFDLPAPNGDPT